ncbi:hypothetical protein J6590_088358 [Homalodisca vitripennis]|nr:hypothetical protein J6590_088358 [Homalodisca vitripennis]
MWWTPGGALLPDSHLTSNSLQQLFSGPNVHQVSAASHVIMSMRYLADPLVELSSQTVILPQTPCNSLSLVQMYIRRYVVDPLVELSSQTVILPQTPCNSFSLVHMYIRSVQLAT